MWRKDLRKRNVLSRWRKWVKRAMTGDFQRTDAATGNERRATVDRRKGGTWSSCVDDDQSRRRPGQRREPADSSMVERCHAARETPWQPLWNRPVLADVTDALSQGRQWCDRNDTTPDEPWHWEQTRGASADKSEARPEQNCRSRVASAQVTPSENANSRQWHIDEGVGAGEAQRNSMKLSVLRTKVAVSVNSQVTNGINRLNKSVGYEKRTAGTSRQLTSAWMCTTWPQSYRRYKLEAIRAHPAKLMLLKITHFTFAFSGSYSLLLATK